LKGGFGKKRPPDERDKTILVEIDEKRGQDQKGQKRKKAIREDGLLLV
jgi:hypothetical protein